MIDRSLLPLVTELDAVARPPTGSARLATRKSGSRTRARSCGSTKAAMGSRNQACRNVDLRAAARTSHSTW